MQRERLIARLIGRSQKPDGGGKAIRVPPSSLLRSVLRRAGSGWSQRTHGAHGSRGTPGPAAAGLDAAEPR